MNPILRAALPVVLLGLLLIGFSSCSSPAPQNNSNQLFQSAPSPTPPLEPTPTPLPARMNLQDAVDQEIITVEAHGVDVSNMTINVTCSHATTIVIPVGTLFTSGDGGTQNMISARDVTVPCAETLTPQIKHVNLEVYCINRLLDAPTKTSQFTVSRLEETDPIRKLDECLANKNAPHQIRQLAIWMVSEDYLNSTREEVAEKLRQHIADDMRKDLDEDKAKLLKEFREKFPQFNDVPDSRLIQVIETRNAEDSVTFAQREVTLYRDKAGPLLKACGINTDAAKFFAAADNP